MKQILLGMLIAMIMLSNIILRLAIEKDADGVACGAFMLLIMFLIAALHMGGI